MRHPFASRPRRGLVVYQLVLILLAIVVLILALLYFARRNQATPGAPAAPAPTTGMLHDHGTRAIRSQVAAQGFVERLTASGNC